MKIKCSSAREIDIEVVIVKIKCSSAREIDIEV